MGDVSPPTTLRIALGVDPGTAIVGYAVVSARGDDLIQERLLWVMQSYLPEVMICV